MTAHNVTVQDSSPLIIYSPGWVDSPFGAPDYANYSGYSAPDFASSHQTNGTASFDFAFNGTGIFVFGTRRSSGGPYSVVISDTDPEGKVTNVVDSPSGTNQASGTFYQSLLFSQTDLKADTQHNIHLANGGQGEFDFDFIIVQTEVGSSGSSVSNFTIDDANPAFTFSVGSWNESTADPNAPNIVNKYWNNGTEHVADGVGAKVTLDFAGTGVEIHGTWFAGNFSVSVDNQPPSIVSSHVNLTTGLYNRPRELVWFADGLSQGNHTIEMTNLGYDNAGISAYGISIDYAIIYTTDASTGGNNTSGGSVNTTSGGSGAQQTNTNTGFATNMLPYNIALLVIFFWMVARMRLV